MKNIIQCLSQMEQYNLDKDTIQDCFNNVKDNIKTIEGYAVRIFLIHLRAYEKKVKLDLDECIADTSLYAIKLAHEYIEKQLYVHHSGYNKKGFKDDLYCNYQCYMQSLKLRMVQILDKFKKENPTHPLSYKTKREFTQSELESEQGNQQNDIIDILNEGMK